MEEKSRWNPVRFECEAISENEGLARAVAAAYVLPADPTVEEITEIKTAVSEAVSNAVIHAYVGREPGRIAMEAWFSDARTVWFSISDTGVGIPDIPLARTPLYTTGQPEEQSGMGFTVMESFMDKVEVRSRVGEGTTVFLCKKLDRGNEW